MSAGGKDEALALAGDFFEVAVLESFTLAFLVEAALAAEVFLETGGLVIILAALGVGVVVHCHNPSANTHAWLSLAAEYMSDLAKSLPFMSSSLTCPPSLVRLKLV